MPDMVFDGKLMDARADRPDVRDRLYNPRLVSLPRQYPSADVIAGFLDRYEGAGLVLNQGSEGACTGFGLACLINYLQFKEAVKVDKELPEPVSPRMLYHLARIYDEWPGEDYDGSSARGAMKGWFHHGVCTEALWPYGTARQKFVRPDPAWAADATRRPLGAYYRIVQDAIPDLQSAICEVGAIYVSACVHAGWSKLGQPRGPIPVPTIPWSPGEAQQGGHAFAIVGYDEEGFIIQNSWGPSWGYQGFARLNYGDWLANGMDAWTATLGAPIAGAAPDIVLVAERTLPASSIELRRGLAGGVTADAAATGTASAWDLATAVRHAVALSNDGALGQPLLVEAANATEAARIVCFEEPLEWLAARPVADQKLVVYAHGGLNDLKKGLARTKVLGKCFQDNGVYPIFVCWQSGVLDTIENTLADVFDRIFAGAPARMATASGALAEARDRAIETLAIPVVRPLWRQMKQNAIAASAPGGGMALLGGALADLRKKCPQMSIHLIGHSAGAIVLGAFMKVMKARGLDAATMSLYAPACTVEFALRQFMKIGADVLAKSAVSVDLLVDDLERADHVSRYGRSLLYLVCRALEETHKTPILGMEAAWNPDLDGKDIFAGSKPRAPAPEVKQWRDAWKNWSAEKSYAPLAYPQVFDGALNMPATHGCFDNWQGCIENTIVRMTGKPLAVPLPVLEGY